MAVDKLVDSAQLDADLTSVANAIRTKGGTSASLAFPADFVSAIGAIPTGGGGGSFVKHTGSFTPASNIYHYEVTGLGAPAMIILCVVHDYATNGLNGAGKHIGNIFADGAAVIISTNNAGTSLSGRFISGIMESWLSGRTVSPDGTEAATSGTPKATTTGFSISTWSGFPFKAGYQYDWVCWTYPEAT